MRINKPQRLIAAVVVTTVAVSTIIAFTRGDDPGVPTDVRALPASSTEQLPSVAGSDTIVAAPDATAEPETDPTRTPSAPVADAPGPVATPTGVDPTTPARRSDGSAGARTAPTPGTRPTTSPKTDPAPESKPESKPEPQPESKPEPTKDAEPIADPEPDPVPPKPSPTPTPAPTKAPPKNLLQILLGM